MNEISTYKISLNQYIFGWFEKSYETPTMFFLIFLFIFSCLKKINLYADRGTAATQELFKILRRKEAGYLEKMKHRKALIDMQSGMPIGYDSTWTSAQNTEPVIICKKADMACTGLQKTYKINSKYSDTLLLAYDFLWKQGNAQTPIIWRAGWKK